MFCRFNLYEPVEFISRHLMDKLEWSKVRDNVAIHVPCSSKKMGIEAAFNAVAQKCSHQITSSDVPCCGKLKLSLSLRDRLTAVLIISQARRRLRAYGWLPSVMQRGALVYSMLTTDASKHHLLAVFAHNVDMSYSACFSMQAWQETGA